MRSDEPERGTPSAGAPFAGLSEMPSVSPIDAKVMGWYPVTRAERVPDMVAALRAESAGWARECVSARVGMVRQVRRLLAANAERLALVLCRETGKPIVEAYGAELLPTLRHLAWLERNLPRLLRPETLGRFPQSRTLTWAPLGVVALLSPWNYPLFLTLPVLLAALAAGNTVLWKPSELALATSHALMDLLAETGLGRLVRMAPGGADLGAAAVQADCDKYLFIGGSETGRLVLEQLGRRLRPAVAELSGIDAMIVCDDADLEPAVRSAVWARVCGGGQTCMAPRRVFVHRRIYAEFLERARRHLRSLRVGHPLDPETEVGPLRTGEALEAAEAAVDDALERGARLLCGGRPVPEPGYYFEPALLADCEEEMAVFRRDVFAPILAVTSCGSDEEAVERATGSPAILTSSVWSRSRRRGLEIAGRLRGGVVSLNDVVLPAAEPDVPFGGDRDAGFGRMRGEAGFRELVQARVIDRGPAGAWPRMHLFPYRPGTLDVLRAMTAMHGAARLRNWTSMWAAMRTYGRRSSCG